MTGTPARLVALNILNRYKPQETNLSELIDTVLTKTPGVADHGFIRDMAKGVVRYLRTIDGIISACSNTKKIEPKIRNILRLGIYQLMFRAKDIPQYAAIDESVELVKSCGKNAASTFVNAVLRKVQKTGRAAVPDYGKDLTETISLKLSYPKWMVKRWLKRFGADETIAFCEACNDQPKLTVRVNALKTSRDELKDLLENEGIVTEFCRYSPDGLRFVSNCSLSKLESFKKGLFCVQDEASQLVSYLLSVKPGDGVVDLCCGAGIKTGHISQIAGNECEIAAVDSSAARLERARENFKTYGNKNIKLIRADVSKLEGLAAQKVLLDAPCSGLGAIRHKPDIKWNRKESDITERYPKLQFELLSRAAQCVNPGGTLVYCTCTTEPEENELVVERFLSGNKDFQLARPELPSFAEELISEEGRYFRTYSHKHGTDSFFGARLIKNG